ncbi:sodium-dependent transporter [Halobacteriovorax sp. GB3]|uniref:sodium-dependent transporter n=1 Tax=Halobacteriovorax sp. GB3 TaxID=2719615 RepID=UPI00235DEC3B|nr:sodium-dependent transporter [Halobacteriovorax sp. GB3]MDD0851599.1 sodium-dependent transporter [Halobacteriovorax sp. GB3]
MDQKKTWSSSLLFIMACVGSAVGLGNLWKFPYIAYENGGGAFVLVYLLCIVVMGLPILLAELIIGREARSNAFEAVSKLSGGKHFWKLLSFLCLFSPFILLSFYSVIAGWSLDYFYNAITGNLTHLTFETTGPHFGAFVSNPTKQISYHTIIMLLTAGVIMKGVKGIEKAIEVLMPFFGIIILTLSVITLSKYGAGKTLNFLFEFDFSKLTTKGILEALGHAFFTLSIGLGAMIIYGAYFPKEHSIIRAGIWITVLDTLVAFCACIMIYPIIFGTGMEVKESASILFTTLSVELHHLPGGQYVCALFYLLVAFAALSSTLSLLELVTSYVEDRFKLSRLKGTMLSTFIIWLFGICSALSNGGNEFFTSLKVMDRLDYILSNWSLPIGAFLISLFCGWVLSEEIKSRELGLKRDDPRYIIFNFLIRYAAPALMMVIFVSQLVN